MTKTIIASCELSEKFLNLKKILIQIFFVLIAKENNEGQIYGCDNEMSIGLICDLYC